MKNNNEMRFVNFINTEALIFDLKLLGMYGLRAMVWMLQWICTIMLYLIGMIKFTVESTIEAFRFYAWCAKIAWGYGKIHIFPVLRMYISWLYNKVKRAYIAAMKKIYAAEEWRMDMMFNQCDMIRYRTELAKLTINVPMIEDSTMVTTVV